VKGPCRQDERHKKTACGYRQIIKRIVSHDAVVKNTTHATPWAIEKRDNLFSVRTPTFIGKFVHFLYEWKE